MDPCRFVLLVGWAYPQNAGKCLPAGEIVRAAADTWPLYFDGKPRHQRLKDLQEEFMIMVRDGILEKSEDGYVPSDTGTHIISKFKEQKPLLERVE